MEPSRESYFFFWRGLWRRGRRFGTLAGELGQQLELELLLCRFLVARFLHLARAVGRGGPDRPREEAIRKAKVTVAFRMADK